MGAGGKALANSKAGQAILGKVDDALGSIKNKVSVVKEKVANVAQKSINVAKSSLNNIKNNLSSLGDNMFSPQLAVDGINIKLPAQSFDETSFFKMAKSNGGSSGVSKAVEKTAEPKLIANKFPNESLPSNGKRIDYTVEDGMIKGLNGQRNVDFIVDSNGKLSIGNKHHYLGDAKDVKAAGQLKLDGQGKVRRIDNLSGHYRPTVNESMNYPDLFNQNGVNIKNSWLELYDIKVDADGLVENYVKVVSQKLK